MCEFAENAKMHDYTTKYVKEVLFENKESITIESSPEWTNERLDWSDCNNDNIARKMNIEEHNYEILQGNGLFEGKLLGGCIDVFQMMIGTSIWPDLNEWEGKILYLETSEDKPSSVYVTYWLRNLVAQGIINKISGIIIGKLKGETYYEEYKEVFKKVIGFEANRSDLPILYNVNFGHSAPMCILPNRINVKVDLNEKKLYFKKNQWVNNCYTLIFKYL